MHCLNSRIMSQIETILNRPGVGSNLQDHIFNGVGPFVIDTPDSTIHLEKLGLKDVLEYKKNGRGPLGTSGTEAWAFITSSYEKEKSPEPLPDLQWTVFGVALSPSVIDILELAFNVPRVDFNTILAGDENEGKNSFLILNTLVRPQSRGKIVLAGSDPNLYPLIYPEYLTHEDDVNALVEGIQQNIFHPKLL